MYQRLSTTLLHVFFCNCVTTRSVHCASLDKNVHLLVFYKYTFHNKHQEHLQHQQLSCQPRHDGTCSSSFRRTWVIVTEKESIERCFPTRPWLFRVATAARKHKKEHPAHCISFFLFHSDSTPSRISSSIQSALQTVGKTRGAFQHSHGCSG